MDKSFTFYTDDLNFTEVITKDGKKCYVEGYASTNDIDFQNDLITKSGLQSMLMQLKSKNIKLDVSHETFRKDMNIIPVAKIIDAKLDEKGVYIKAVMNNDSPKFKNTWGSVKNGFLDAFSVAFNILKSAKQQIGNKTVRMIDDLILRNITFTGNPVNKNATIGQVFMKSLDAYQNTQDITVSNEEQSSKNIEDNKMTDETQIKDEAQPVTEPVQPVEPVKEPVKEPVAEPKVEEKAAVEPKETEEPKAEDKKEEPKKDDAELKDLKSEVTELKSLVEASQKMITELKAKMEAPVLKGVLEQPNPETIKALAETEFKGTLDLIR